MAPMWDKRAAGGDAVTPMDAAQGKPCCQFLCLSFNATIQMGQITGYTAVAWLAKDRVELKRLIREGSGDTESLNATVAGIAGFIDAEGCFSTDHMNGILVQINHVDTSPLTAIQRHLQAGNLSFKNGACSLNIRGPALRRLLVDTAFTDNVIGKADQVLELISMAHNEPGQVHIYAPASCAPAC